VVAKKKGRKEAVTGGKLEKLALIQIRDNFRLRSSYDQVHIFATFLNLDLRMNRVNTNLSHIPKDHNCSASGR
jgi:hypothetical protein